MCSLLEGNEAEEERAKRVDESERAPYRDRMAAEDAPPGCALRLGGTSGGRAKSWQGYLPQGEIFPPHTGRNSKCVTFRTVEQLNELGQVAEALTDPESHGALRSEAQAKAMALKFLWDWWTHEQQAKAEAETTAAAEAKAAAEKKPAAAKKPAAKRQAVGGKRRRKQSESESESESETKTEAKSAKAADEGDAAATGSASSSQAGGSIGIAASLPANWFKFCCLSQDGSDLSLAFVFVVVLDEEVAGGNAACAH